jgi:glycine cleavage system H protein
MNVPENLRYAKSHEWLRPADGVVGITDHAQSELSDVVFVDLPKVGRKVKAGETIAVVESVKAASDIYSPASGEVVEVNGALADNAALVNTDPFGAGWMFKLKLDNAAEANALMDAAGYKAQIGA